MRAVSDQFGQGHELEYEAAPGERNDVVLAPRGVGVRVSDVGAVLTLGAHCRSVDAHTAVCRGPRNDPYVTDARVAVGDLDDRVRSKASLGYVTMTADGGEGDDVLISDGALDVLFGGGGNDKLYGGDEGDDLDGGGGQDLLDGGDGDDELDGGGGQDQLSGGRGNDTLTDGDRDGAAGDAAPGPDILDGGPDSDSATYAQRINAVRVHGGVDSEAGEPGERDAISRIEFIVGGSGDDELIADDRGSGLSGGAGDDHLLGGRGDDLLDGDGGNDDLLGGGGNDLLDGGRGNDMLGCGPGNDVVVNVFKSRRLREVLPRPCEQLRFGWGQPGGGELTLRAHPEPGRAHGVIMRTACPLVSSEAYVGCRGVIALHETGGRRRLLARGRFRHGADGARFAVHLAVTLVGRRWLGGRTRASTSVVLHMNARGTPRRAFRWTFGASNMTV